VKNRGRRHAPVQGRPQAPVTWWRAVLVVVAIAVVYANSLTGPFVFDDNFAIVNNPAAHDIRLVGQLLHERNTPVAGRPIVGLSFALNFAVGGLAVDGYHLVNIALHAACALLLFAFLRRMLTGPGRDELALAAALLWSVHPLNSEVVDYLTQRSESLMALFFLSTLYCALRSAGARRAWGWQTGAVLACAFGMASKESMVVAPVVVALCDRVFLYPTFAEAFRNRWRLYGGLALCWIVLAYLMLQGPRSGSVSLAPAVTAWTYFLNQLTIIPHYLRLAGWPTGLAIAYGPPTPVDLAPVVAGGVFLLALALLTVLAFQWQPAAGFAGAWFFITLAPTSSFVPIVTEVGAERRMYLPLMALVAVVVVGLARAPRLRAAVSARAAWLIVAVLCGALGATTIARNREYRSPLALAESVLRNRPTDMAHGMVGGELIALHRDDEAIPELRLAARTHPASRYNLGVALFNVKRLDEAITELDRFARETPDLEEVPAAHRIMGHALVLEGKWPEAENQLRRALSMAPSDPDARALLASVMNHQGLEEASAGHPGRAVAAFREAATLTPESAVLQTNLAAALLDAGQAGAAETAAREAARLDPRSVGAHDLLGRALAVQGKMGDAISHFQRAIQLDPKDPQPREDLERVLPEIERRK
jgi:protein O-mannosyl-transferase